MKKTVLLCGCALALYAMTAIGYAAEPALAVANMEQIFKEHQQLKQVIAQLNEQNAKFADERKALVGDMEKRQQELRKLNTDALSATLPEAERTQRREQAELKLHDFRVLEAKIMRADEANRRQMTTRLQEVRLKYFNEVQTHIRAYAAEHQLALVLDSSPLAAQGGIGGVLHADSQLDITAAIIARINQPQPATTNAAVAPQK